MAIATEATLSKLNKAELVAAVTDLQSALAIKDAAIEALGSPATDVAGPATTECPTDLMMTGYLRSVAPKTKRDGSVIPGIYQIAVQATVSVNFGGSQREEWDYQDINHKVTYFQVDAQSPLVAQAEQLLSTNKWTVVRGWYKLTSRPANVQTVAKVDPKTNAKVLNDQGEAVTFRKLQYAPDLRLEQLDVVASAEAADEQGDLL